jgi:diguanylate cyclase (GGDEF)-like protein
MDLEAVLHAVAEQLTHVVGASMCMIHERTSDGVRVVARYERGGSQGTSRLYDPGVNLLKLPRNELEPIGQRSSIIKRWDVGGKEAAAAILDYHGSSVALVVPMVARDQTVGIAEIYRTSADPFSESDVSLVEAVTTQAALATENARAFGHVTFAANHDPVTGLLNHRALHEEMSGLFKRALATDRPLTVVMMDLNLFKEFNDRYGHQAGDAVLTDIAHAIIECVPSSSIAARYGGDEFTVVVPDFPPENAPMFISAIRDRVALIQDRYGFIGEGFGIAAGIASFPEDGAVLSGLIAQADERMYDDKRRLKGFSDRRKGGISFTGYSRDSAGIPIDTNL